MCLFELPVLSQGLSIKGTLSKRCALIERDDAGPHELSFKTAYVALGCQGQSIKDQQHFNLSLTWPEWLAAHLPLIRQLLFGDSIGTWVSDLQCPIMRFKVPVMLAKEKAVKKQLPFVSAGWIPPPFWGGGGGLSWLSFSHAIAQLTALRWGEFLYQTTGCQAMVESTPGPTLWAQVV